MNERSKPRWDAVVAGAGPSGAAAALALARSGALVLLFERSAFPRWKVCGACLGPAALASLDRLGAHALTVRAGAVPLSRMVLRSQRKAARLRLSGWAALSRATLDEHLVGVAARAGVTVWTEARVALGPVGADARTVRVTRAGSEIDVEARIVIDATGLGRGLAEDGGATTHAAPHTRVGVGTEIEAPDYPVAAGELHMTVGRPGYVGLVRVEHGRLNVAAAVDPSALRGSSPGGVIAGILAHAGLPPLPPTAANAWRGTPGLTRAGDAGADRLLRTGDAAGYVEPFTGEGIGWALADGLAAAECARAALEGRPADSLAQWRRHRAARRATAERLCRGLARGLRRPRLVGLAVTALGAVPELAAPFIRRVARDHAA
jgi:flavin-dependent dehydrogenase